MMVSAKKTRPAASKISAAAAPASGSVLYNSSKSGILRSLFCPSHYQLSLFASVIHGLDSQHLRIHDTATGRLRCEHGIASRATINCLDWGHCHTRREETPEGSARKKRRKSEKANGPRSTEDVVLAYGASDSYIRLYSPAEDKVVSELHGVHTTSIVDFKFAEDGKGWSLGTDGILVKWNIQSRKGQRIWTLPTGPASALHPTFSSVIVASHIAYNVDPPNDSTSFPASINPVHSIVPNTSQRDSRFSSFLTAAESDRFANVFNTSSRDAVGNLVASTEIESLAFFDGSIPLTSEREIDLTESVLKTRQALAAINKDGELELFRAPFNFPDPSRSIKDMSQKARMKQRTRKADGLVKIIRPDKFGTAVPLLNATFQYGELILVWVEGGVKLVFDRIPWRDENSGDFLIKGLHQIVKERTGAGIGAVVMNGVKDMGRTHVDESHAVVVNGNSVEDVRMNRDTDTQSIIEISSAEEESEIEDSEEEASPEPLTQTSDVRSGAPEPMPQSQKQIGSDVDMEDVEDHAEEVAEEPEAPSFGELMRANAPGPIDVPATFSPPDTHALTSLGQRNLDLPPGMSLGTVLTQSLRTNDVNLLETCFHVHDLSIVRATIERLDSSLASVLMQRLAERLHSRPGRAGTLMVWIQWTLVVHGGYIASQPAMMKELSSLHAVVKERAKALQPLLSLKGKLDMLEAQMNLRRSMLSRSGVDVAQEDDEDAVVYVEGQEESDSESVEDEEEEDDRKPIEKPKPKRSRPKSKLQNEASDSSDDSSHSDTGSSSEDDMPTTTNGPILDSEDSEDSYSGFIDDEASSTSADTGDEDSADSVNHSDIDSQDSGSSEEEAGPPPPPVKKARLTNGVGKGRYR